MTEEVIKTIGKFSMANYLRTEEDIQEYYDDVLRDGDAEEIEYAKGIINVARKLMGNGN